LGTSTFTSSFIKNVVLKDIQHMHLFFRMGDVQITFEILIHCFVQRPLYLLQYTPLSSTFIKFFIFFTPPFFKCLGAFWVQDLLIIEKDFYL
jgi:hypothetical protein